LKSKFKSAPNEIDRKPTPMLALQLAMAHLTGQQWFGLFLHDFIVPLRRPSGHWGLHGVLNTIPKVTLRGEGITRRPRDSWELAYKKCKRAGGLHGLNG
jgi:hypothetical protein